MKKTIEYYWLPGLGMGDDREEGSGFVYKKAIRGVCLAMEMFFNLDFLSVIMV
jgi:hypothetical protein